MENIEHIDVHNLELQRRDAIIETGKYTRVEIVVGKDNLPTCSLHVAGVGTEQMALLIQVMLQLQKEIIKRDPAAGVLATMKKMKTDSYYTENNKEDKNKEG